MTTTSTILWFGTIKLKTVISGGRLWWGSWTLMAPVRPGGSRPVLTWETLPTSLHTDLSPHANWSSLMARSGFDVNENVEANRRYTSPMFQFRFLRFMTYKISWLICQWSNIESIRRKIVVIEHNIWHF